jgi:glycerophosphoryl diester phosphodiesterase
MAKMKPYKSPRYLQASFFLSILLLGSCVPEQQLLPDNQFLIDEGSRPWVIAHGGAKQLFPENTMMAFEGSYNIGVDALEMDIKITSDDILVCHHDHDIDRMSDGTGMLNDFTLEALKAFNFGDGFKDLDGNYPYRDTIIEICVLEDVFERFPDSYFVVEIKDREEQGEKAAEVLYDLIEKYYLKDRIIVASFDDKTLSHFSEVSGSSVPISASEKEARQFVITSKALVGIFYRPDAVAVQLPLEQAGLNLAKGHVIESAHRHNMAVHYWTINDPEEMEELIDLGADGLITDRPDLMNDLLDEMGY